MTRCLWCGEEHRMEGTLLGSNVDLMTCRELMLELGLLGPGFGAVIPLKRAGELRDELARRFVPDEDQR